MKLLFSFLVERRFNVKKINKLYNQISLEELLFKYNLALQMIETEISVLIKDYEYKLNSNPVDHIKTRLKSKESILKKLNKKKYEPTNENIIKHIHDIIGIRIVCSFLPDVYEIVKLIRSSDRFRIKEEKDYIKNPKETGYISYHMIVEIPIYLDKEKTYFEAEVQIRTMAMDFWASLEHKISYKTDKIPEEINKEMIDCSLDIKSLDEKMYKLNEITKKYRR